MPPPQVVGPVQVILFHTYLLQHKLQVGSSLTCRDISEQLCSDRGRIHSWLSKHQRSYAMSCKPAQQLTKGVPLPSTWTGHALGDFEHQHVLLRVLPSGLFFLLFSLSTSESLLGSITACVSDVSTGPRTTGNASDGSLRRNVYAKRKSNAYRWYCGLSSDQINIWITCSLHEHEYCQNMNTIH